MKPTRYSRSPRVERFDTPLGRERYIVRWTEPGRVSRKKYFSSRSAAEEFTLSLPRLENRTMAAVLTNRTRVNSETGCWEVSGSIKANGYPRLATTARKNVNTHRVMFELWYGDIPDGLELDHICRNQRCCNPEHLEPVVHAENTRRGESPTAVAARTNVCRNGHEFSPDNTYVSPSGSYRRCRTCDRAQQRRRRSESSPARRA